MDNNELILRPFYQKKLEQYQATPQIKVLQGVRRCGKSSILVLYKKSLLNSGVEQSNIFFKRFDVLEQPLDYSAQDLLNELNAALSIADSNNPFYVFLDEVQDVPEWERVVRRLHTQPNIDVYITGSNAHMLSSDLATHLAGRTVKINVFPLSYQEYVHFSKEMDDLKEDDALFEKYLRYGGMPGLFSLKRMDDELIARELSGIFDTVLLNDVAIRSGIRDVSLLERLVKYLFSTSGNLFSTRKVVGALTSAGRKTSSETVDSYIDSLTQAYLLYEAEQYGIGGKKILNPLRKFYAVDSGLRNLSIGFSSQDLGFQLEGVVYSELLRNGFDVSVGVTENAEVDFIAQKNNERMYIQVCTSLLDSTVRERELEPLRQIKDSFPKIVLTLDKIGCGTTNDGIRIINLTNWLLQK